MESLPEELRGGRNAVRTAVESRGAAQAETRQGARGSPQTRTRARIACPPHVGSQWYSAAWEGGHPGAGRPS